MTELKQEWPPKGIKWYYADDHTAIAHGDCRTILPQLENESFDVMWTDPPYGHGNHDGDLNARLNEHRGLEQQPIANDDAESMREVVSFALKESARVLKRDCCCCCCCGGGGPKPTFAWVAQQMDANGLSFFHSVIWDKRNPGLGWRYRRQHEMVMVAHRVGGKLRWANDSLAVPNIVSMMPPRDRVHPNEKPLNLVSSFLVWHSMQGDAVLDPFAGSGTTLLAAKQLGRLSVGIELDEAHCETAARRLSDQEYLPLNQPPTPQLSQPTIL
jgi:DNA modification methylase